ncbi:MAG: hypothetical protein MHPSP_001281 [Paramarteilia canceri]
MNFGPAGSIPASNDQDQNRPLKIVVLGQSGTGKTTWLKRLLDGHFERKYESTMGAHTFNLQINTNKGPVSVVFWDTAGQEQLGGLVDGYYHNTDYAVYMMDITSKASLTNMNNWLCSLFKIAKKCKFVAVGNKLDLEHRGRQFKEDKLYHNIKGDMANRFLGYMEMSVKSGGDKIREPLARFLTDKFKVRNIEIYAEQITRPQTYQINSENMSAIVDKGAAAKFNDDDDFEADAQFC